MPKQIYYLAKAAEAEALADRIGDALSERTLRQAAQSWRLLAQTEKLGTRSCLDPTFPGE